MVAKSACDRLWITDLIGTFPRAVAIAGSVGGDTGGKIVMTPKLPIDGSRFRTADGEYTPAQRRMINARLAKADADIKAGRVSKAFSDHAEVIAALHKEAAKLSAKKTKRQAK